MGLSRITVIIPAAGEGRRMSGVLAADKFTVPKSLLELGRRPVLVEIMDTIEKIGKDNGFLPEYRVVTSPVGRDGIKLRKFLKGYYSAGIGKRISFHTQTRFPGPLSAVMASGVKKGPMLIWLCDTLLAGEHPRLFYDSLYTATVKGNLSRWCLVETDKRGNISRFVDKPRNYRQRSASSRPERDCCAGAGRKSPQALIGIYAIKDAKLFREAGLHVLNSNLMEHGEYQLSTALNEYMKRRPLRAVKVADWLDVGTPGNFMTAKEHYLEKLQIHQLHIDARLRLVSKTVKCKKYENDLADEASWYSAVGKVNPLMRGHIPRHIAFTGKTLRMEYVDLPNLADWYLYRSFYLTDESRRTFRDFLRFAKTRVFKEVKSSAKERFEANWSMLVNKTQERLRQLRRPGILKSNFCFNGKPLNSWNSQREKFHLLARRYSGGHEKNWGTIHGDLVFSNVLADGCGRFVLVDPRGSYGGKPQVVGDRYYDLAKIAQCVFSQYDCIKKEEYVFTTNSRNDYRLVFPRSGCSSRRLWKTEFCHFCSEEKIDMRRLRFFEATLLLSLLPLHREKEEQVLVAFLTGLNIINALE